MRPPTHQGSKLLEDLAFNEAGGPGGEGGDARKSADSCKQRARDFRDNVIMPTLDWLGWGGADAVDFMLGIAITESALARRLQRGGGPARGLYQIEPRTHDDVWAQVLRGNESATYKVGSLRIFGKSTGWNLTYNDAYATAIARAHFTRWDRDLPRAGDRAAQAAEWKTYYNTNDPRAKGTTDRFEKDVNWCMGD